MLETWFIRCIYVKLLVCLQVIGLGTLNLEQTAPFIGGYLLSDKALLLKNCFHVPL